MIEILLLSFVMILAVIINAGRFQTNLYYGMALVGILLCACYYFPILYKTMEWQEKVILDLTAFPVLIGAVLAGFYYSFVVVLPFLLLSVSIYLFVYLYETNKILASISCLLLILSIYFCYGALQHIAYVYKVTHLKQSQILSVSIKGSMLTTPKRLRSVANALSSTFPYAGNHDHPTNFALLEIQLTTGEVINLRISKGRRGDPNTTWVIIDGRDYQNSKLTNVLENYFDFQIPSG